MRTRKVTSSIFPMRGYHESTRSLGDCYAAHLDRLYQDNSRSEIYESWVFSYETHGFCFETRSTYTILGGIGRACSYPLGH
jgi:hypothetical protein